MTTPEDRSVALVDERFSLAPRNLTEAMEYSKLIATSEICPKQFQGKAGDVLVAIQFGMEVGLSPLQGLQNIAVINGRPTIWGDAALALVLKSGKCEEHRERDQNEAGKKAEGLCFMRRKGDPNPIEVRFTVDDAKKAGLWGKQGPWTQYPGRMLQLRARGFAMRDKFADVLKGLSVREEVEDYMVDATTRQPVAMPEMTTIEGKGEVKPGAADKFLDETAGGKPANGGSRPAAATSSPEYRVRVISVETKSKKAADKTSTWYELRLALEKGGEQVVTTYSESFERAAREIAGTDVFARITTKQNGQYTNLTSFVVDVPPAAPDQDEPGAAG